MIADEDVAHRFEELRHVLKGAFLQSGVLGALRAQMRVAALDALKGTQADGVLQSILGVHKPPPPPVSESGRLDENDLSPERLALLLVYDYLHHFSTLRRSAGVFAEESGVGHMRAADEGAVFSDTKRMAEQQLRLGVEWTPQQHAQEPLLVAAMRGLKNGSASRPSSASSATTATTTAMKTEEESKRQISSSAATTTTSSSVSPSTPIREKLSMLSQQQQQPSSVSNLTGDIFFGAMSASATSSGTAVFKHVTPSSFSDVASQQDAAALKQKDQKEAEDWEEAQELEPLPSADSPSVAAAKLPSQVAKTATPTAALGSDHHLPSSVALQTHKQQTSSVADRVSNVLVPAALKKELPPLMAGPSLTHRPSSLAPLDPVVSVNADEKAKKKKATKKKKKTSSSASLSSPSASSTATQDDDDESDGETENMAGATNDSSVASSNSVDAAAVAVAAPPVVPAVALLVDEEKKPNLVPQKADDYADDFEDDDAF